jgi:hypothetical protein
MKVKISIMILPVFLLLAGCTKTVYVPVDRTTTVTKTVRDTVVDYRIEQIRDSVTIPAKDSISYLSNRYAYTYARVSDGKLSHSLATWADSVISVRVNTVYVERTDSVPKPYPVERTVYRDRELNLWQKIRMRAGEVALIMILIAAAYYIYKRRKSL